MHLNLRVAFGNIKLKILAANRTKFTIVVYLGSAVLAKHISFTHFPVIIYNTGYKHLPIPERE